MRLKTFALTLGAILLVGAGCSSTTDDGVSETVSPQKINTQADFVDYDGNKVNLGDFEGEYIVVNAWATWCPFCTKELPEFASVQRAFGNKVRVIAIDRKESKKRAKEFTDELGITDDLLFLLDPRDTFYKSIGGFSMPETVFVNKEGEIVHHKRGPVNEAQFTELVNTLINDKF